MAEKFNLNKEQQAAYEQIEAAKCMVDRPKMFFITGASGTGKTYLLNAIASIGKCVAMAYTRIGATLLDGGATVFSEFQVDWTNLTTPQLVEKDSSWHEIAAAEILIFDQVNFYRKEMIDKMNDKVQEIMNCQKPFGGKMVIFAGDFRQFLPIVCKAPHTEELNMDLLPTDQSTSCHLRMQNLTQIQLTKNMRFTEISYFVFLEHIARGFLREVHLPRDWYVETLDELVEFVYGQDGSRDDIDEKIILTTRVSEENQVKAICSQRYHGDIHPNNFALTIHKAQNKTFRRVGIWLREQVFTHGMLYVALASVRDLNNLRIKLGSDAESHEGPILNIVLQEFSG